MSVIFRLRHASKRQQNLRVKVDMELSCLTTEIFVSCGNWHSVCTWVMQSFYNSGAAMAISSNMDLHDDPYEGFLLSLMLEGRNL